MLFLIAGLGNPGKAYQANRHNVGFRVVDQLADDHGIFWSKKRFSATTGSGKIGNQRVLLLKPLTFMNRSGDAVGAASRYFKVPLERIAVIHDDLDLALGRIQVRRGGGHGGHHGLLSVIQALGEADFLRFRLGVNRPGNTSEVIDYVLRDFDPEEVDAVEEVIQQAAQAVAAWLSNGLTVAMNRYNPWPR